MKKIYITVLYLIIISHISCDNSEKKIIFSGKININTKIDTIRVDIFDGKEFQPFDTILTAGDKSFETQYPYTEQVLIRLHIQNQNPIDIILNKNNIFIDIREQENEMVYKINGSPDTEYLIKGDSLYKQHKKHLQALYGEISDSTNTLKTEEGIFLIQAAYNQQIKKLIWKTHNSISGILLTNLLQNNEHEILFLDSISEKFSQEVSNKSYKSYFYEKIEKIKSLPIGSISPQIHLPSPHGEPISLISLRGKYVLVDFWASWCKPCREENPTLQKIYKKYNIKGLEIFSISLDKHKESWIKAIEEDKMEWKNGLDIQAPIQQAIKIYNITYIPYWILLDKKGIIIEKKTEGKEIEMEIEKIFNKF